MLAPAFRIGPESRHAQRSLRHAIAVLLAFGFAAGALPARAQVVTDIELQADFGGTVNGVGGVFTLDEAEGLRPGGGLDRFHVFENFDLGPGDTAEWVSALPTRNIFNLVSGGSASQIDGLLRSALDADLYFVNPEGIVFGENAQLDLVGSFFASTADALDFDDGGRLELDGADGPTVLALSTADFAAFGFLASDESIDVTGAQLQLPDDQVLGLHAARHVRIGVASGLGLARLRAGRVELTTNEGDVRLRGGEVFADRGAVVGGAGVRFVAGDDIEIDSGSRIESAGELGVELTGRTIEIEDAGTEVVALGANVVGGDVAIDAKRRITIRDDARVASLATGTGSAGDVRIEGRDLLLLRGSVETRSAQAGAGQGDIDIEIDRVVNIVGGSITSDVPDGGAGRISIEAPLVVMQGEAEIASSASSIEIETDLLVRSAESEIDGVDVDVSGNQIIRNLQADLNERLEVLPQRFFETRIRLDPSCAARSGETQGSLMVDGRRAPPDRPEHLRTAAYQTARARAPIPPEPQAGLDLPNRLFGVDTPSGDDWLYLAQGGERLGNLASAGLAATRGLAVAERAAERAGLFAVRGRIRARLGEGTLAAGDFASARDAAEASGEPAVGAAVELDRAVALAWRGEFGAARDALVWVTRRARESGALAIALAAEANLVSVLWANDEQAAAIERLEQHLSESIQRHAGADEFDSLLHLALAAKRAGLRQQAADRWVEIARRAIALELDRATAFAWADLAQLYAEEQRLDEAIELTRWAIDASLGADGHSTLASFEAQHGDLLQRRGDLAQAIESYDRALRATPLLAGVGVGTGPFAAPAKSSAIPRRLVGALLERAEQIDDPVERAKLLRRARDSVEAERVRELRDHFRDPCIVALERRPADAIPGAVVVHPVVLHDRLALIVSSEAGLRAYDVAVDEQTLLETLRRTRRDLRDRSTNRYQLGAARLYDWLIRPLEAELDRPDVETVVFVAGEGLRGFPMGALWDAAKKEFLIEKIAVAATPGLTLIRPRPLDPAALVVLRAGLDPAPEGVAPLPNVAQELDAIGRLFEGVDLRADAFAPAQLERALEARSFDVIHIASHGRFPRDGSAPHLVTAHEPLGLRDLADMIRRTRFRDRPTELITLSACETAIGDERAALGFAGLAIQSGARSTLATLWRVNDVASARLMEDFYGELASGEMSRAAALREAQRSLLRDTVLRHPYFWSPYLLLGNWQ